MTYRAATAQTGFAFSSTSLPTLGPGAWGDEVWELQQSLADWLTRTNPVRAQQFAAICEQARRRQGYAYYGPQTKEVVRQYQRARGLKDDGIVGPRTWGKLEPGGVPRRPVVAPTVPEPTAPDPGQDRQRGGGLEVLPAGVDPRVLRRYEGARANAVRWLVQRTKAPPHSVVERWRVLVAACFPADAVNDALRTIFYESSGRPHVPHWNNNGSVDVGLFQMNSVHRGGYGIQSAAEWKRVMATATDMPAAPPPPQAVNNVMAAFVLFTDARGRFGRDWVAVRRHGIP
jgi:hypothetical protein